MTAKIAPFRPLLPRPGVWLLVAYSAWAAGGCSYQVVSPPARMVSLETARTAARGETVVGAKTALHTAVFDPGVGVASGGIRRGVADQVEVNADLTWAHLLHDSYPDLNRNIYAARVGAKLSNKGGSAALLSGVGGGFAPAGGGFTAADVGFALSYPNCYVLPFLNGTAGVSLPIGAKQVDFKDSSNGTVVASDKAVTTFGMGVSTGIEIPLARARCREGLTPPRLQLGVSMNVLFPSDGRVTPTSASPESQPTNARYGTLGLGMGVEFPF